MVKKNSIIDNYLKDVQERVKRECKKPKPGKPQEYEDGTFWVKRKDPAFLLKDQARLDPNELYHPRVFLWFPHHLSDNLTCPRCTVPTTIQIKEWSTKTRARRIIDIDE